MSVPVYPDAQILPIMVGTAGHVDHGKTSLVRHLTAFNTDTLKEEKERGMTIDFGVAPCPISENRVVGIIDVPGHRDFIRNMVAGASSIDVLMLVVAADDSVMPQTREHVRIVSMLGMSRLMVVITKIDLVDPETLLLVREELQGFLEDLGFKSAPIVEVSNASGQGIEEVRTVLSNLVSQVAERKDPRAFRMYVRKAFTMKGYGTVVTGVPVSGEISPGSRLDLLPGKRELSVRSVQNYRSEVQVAKAHISTAVNLRDGEPAEFERGMALVEPDRYDTSVSIVAQFKNHSDYPLKRRFQCRFHSGTSAVAVRARLLYSAKLDPGEQGFIAVNFNHEQVISLGDKFIMRMLSPETTIGGGVVLGTYSERLRVKREPKLNLLKRAAVEIESGSKLEVFFSTSSHPVIKREDVLRALHIDDTSVLAQLNERLKESSLVSLGENRWLLAERVSELGSILHGALRAYHSHNKLALGMNTKQAAEILGIPANTFAKLWKQISAGGMFVMRNEFVALSTFKPQMSEREFRLKQKVLDQVKLAGAQTIAKGPLEESLSMTAAEMKAVTKLLVDEGEIVVLGSNLILRTIMDDFEKALLSIFSQKQLLELKDFRDATETSRNMAVAILEYFDAKGLTKRQGNARLLAQKGLI